MKIYNVFYSNLFQKSIIETLTGQISELLSLIIVNNKHKWEAEDIFNAKSHEKKFDIRLNGLVEMMV